MDEIFAFLDVEVICVRVRLFLEGGVFCGFCLFVSIGLFLFLSPVEALFGW